MGNNKYSTKKPELDWSMPTNYRHTILQKYISISEKPKYPVKNNCLIIPNVHSANNYKTQFRYTGKFVAFSISMRVYLCVYKTVILKPKL